ncbi:uncharacterized protein [Euphorbia lathyris]|uniref:uncharacterized protein n=1 Tax=Euphorbia lathyris TaxID=212925 RepID=UPI00331378C8
MHGFSTADGFVEITEDLTEMIKYVANEPSVGLFYVQQHTQHAVPNVINLKNNIVEKSRETVLHTEDTEDSITMLKSMKDCGSSIADEMIKDIRASLALMSEKQPRRGLISNASLGFQIGRSSSWGPASWGHNRGQPDRGGSGTYFSTVLKTAKEKATNLKWPQLDPKELTPISAEKLLSNPDPARLIASASTSSSMPDMESDELPVSSQAVDELQEKDEQVETSLISHNLLSQLENYEDFKADKEAKLEDWLEKTNGTNRLDKIE